MGRKEQALSGLVDIADPLGIASGDVVHMPGFAPQRIHKRLMGWRCF